MQDELRLELEQLIDRFVLKGNTQPEVIASIRQALDQLTNSYEEDPDPSDDPKEIDEPANDWPGA